MIADNQEKQITQIKEIAILDPITQTANTFNTICEVWATAPYVEECRLSVSHKRATLHRVSQNKMGAPSLSKNLEPLSRPLSRAEPLDVISWIYLENIMHAVFVIPDDMPPPAYPGGWQALTYRSPEISKGKINISRPKPGIAILLSSWTFTGDSEPRQPKSSATQMPLNYDFAILDLTIEQAHMKPFAQWMLDYGFDLRFACAERINQLLMHPHVDWLFDPKFKPSALTIRERAYLTAIAEHGTGTFLSDTRISKLLGTHRQTAATLEAPITEKYGHDHYRRAFQAGLLALPDGQASEPGKPSGHWIVPSPLVRI